MEVIEREIKRLQLYLKECPDIEIWIVSGTKNQAKVCWKIINDKINCSKKPVFLSSNELDGLNPHKSLILLCDKWYKNKIIRNGVFIDYLDNAKFTIPIGELSY